MGVHVCVLACVFLSLSLFTRALGEIVPLLIIAPLTMWCTAGDRGNKVI